MTPEPYKPPSSYQEPEPYQPVYEEPGKIDVVKPGTITFSKTTLSWIPQELMEYRGLYNFLLS